MGAQFDDKVLGVSCPRKLAISSPTLVNIKNCYWAGASGVALLFCDTKERAYLRDIQHTINQKIPVAGDHPFLGNDTEPIAGNQQSTSRVNSQPKSVISVSVGEKSQKSRRPYWKKRRPKK
ncbi:MAG: hypothetical protein AAF944_03375 [Bacteroidota bacterium]